MTTRDISAGGSGQSWFGRNILLGQAPGEYLRSLLTPFHVVAALILWLGIPVAVIRFSQGLASTTNLSDTNPWGLWIGFDVLSGVALAAGGYVVASAIYIFGLKEYRPIVRPAVLTALLGYTFVAVGLLFDLGRPWRLPYPVFVSFGVTSVMLEVAWCVFLYLGVLFMEFSPAVTEWLGWKRLRRVLVGLTLVMVVSGVVLSTLHQSSLGALFLLTPGKLHPLWYSPLIPLFFFVSSIAAGMSMVIVESLLSHRIFLGNHDVIQKEHLDRITLGLGKAGAAVLFVYFWLKLGGVVHNDSLSLLVTPLGYWFLVELLGFVALPSLLFLVGSRTGNAGLVRIIAAWTVIGIVLNRLNVSIIAFNWQAAERYVPRWSEILITVMIVTLGVMAFKWIVNRMPVLRPDPRFGDEH